MVLNDQRPAELKQLITSLGIHLVFGEEIIKPQLNHQLCQQIYFDLFNEWIRKETINGKLLPSCERL
jgi:hypothetical protein